MNVVGAGTAASGTLLLESRDVTVRGGHSDVINPCIITYCGGAGFRSGSGARSAYIADVGQVVLGYSRQVGAIEAWVNPDGRKLSVAWLMRNFGMN